MTDTSRALRHVIYTQEPGIDGTGITAAEKTQLVLDVAEQGAGIQRVDPGETGLAGQTLTMGPSGPVWLEEPTFNVKHPRFGAVGDDITDDTAAIQSAIDLVRDIGGGTVMIPRGNYSIAGTLTIDFSNLILRGTSRGSRIVKRNSGTLIELDGARSLSMEGLNLTATGGHILDSLKALSNARFYDCTFDQHSLGHSVFHLDDTISGRPQADYVHNVWDHCHIYHKIGATVPTTKIKSYAANRNRWVDIWPQYSGNYAFWIESTHHDGAAAVGNRFESITAETLIGGGFKILGGMGTEFNNIDFWDPGGAYAKHLIDLGTATVNGNKHTIGTQLTNVRRVDGSLGGGIYDLYLGDNTDDTTLISCGGYPFRPMEVRNRGNILQIGGQVSHLNRSGVSQINVDNRSWFAHPVRTQTYSTASRPTAVAAAPGGMIFDTTLNKPIWSDGSNWRDANGTVV